VSDSTFEHIVIPPLRDLGEGFHVRRALPGAACRAVGPFVFFDHFGPTTFQAGAGLDVRPHPHIGLATVTYLFEGVILHRDSLGTAQLIRPEAVNWMIAGGGVVHSERTPADTRRDASSLSGIQAWVALPVHQEECPARFAHHDARELPLIESAGRRIRLIAGSLFGEHAPVATLSAMGYADAILEPRAQLQFDCQYSQRAIYLAQGTIAANGRRFEAAQLLVLRAGETCTLQALERSRLMLLAGEPLEGPRFVWWNFVSSSRARLEQAKTDWREGRFDKVPGDDREFIPLPAAPAPSSAAPPPIEGDIL
jgi:redox-sensitive bicupin YhaK (pirin superfamily)